MNRIGTSREGAVYAAASAGLSLIGLGGLAIGFALGESPVGHMIAKGAPILKGTLLGALLEVLRGSIAPPALEAGKGLAGYFPLALYFLVPLLGAAVIVSCALTIAALFCPRRAKRLFHQNGRLLLLFYSLPFLGNFLARALAQEPFGAKYFDLSCLIAAGSAALILFAASLREQKMSAALNFLLFLLSAGGIFSFGIPEAFFTEQLGDVVFSNGNPSFAAKISLILLFSLVLWNALISSFRLNAGRGRWFDALRFGIQLSLFVATTVLLSPGIGFSMILSRPLSAVLLFSCSLCSFVLSCFSAAKKRKKRAVPVPLLALPAPMPDEEEAALCSTHSDSLY